MNHKILVAIFVAFIITVGQNLVAQTTQKTLDSTLAILPHAKADTNKVMLLCDVSAYYFQLAPAKATTYALQALQLALQLHYDYGIMEANSAIGRSYAVQDNLPQALKYFQDELTAARKLKNDKYIGNALSSLGLVYKQDNEYDKAISYLLDAENAYKRAGVKNMAMVMSNIGTVYGQQSKIRTGLPYNLAAIAMEEADKARPIDLAIYYGNTGGVYTALHRYDSGLYYLSAALALANRVGNLKSSVYIKNHIGEAYLALANTDEVRKSGFNAPDSLKNTQRNLATALRYEQEALATSRELGLKDPQVYILDNLSEIYKAQHDYKAAFEVTKQYDDLKDSLHSADNGRAFDRVEAEFKVQKTTDSLKYQNLVKDNELKQKRNQRNSLLGAVVFLGIISLLFINRQKLKHVQREKIARVEKLRAEELAGHQLADFTQRIQEKNQLIEVITNEIEKYKEQSVSNNGTIDYALLTELQQSILLTDEQWDKFKNTFDKVNEGYTIRLRAKMPDISPAETRFVLLSKLQLTNKEMAAMLGIGAQAIRATKYRLMKKLDIEDDSTLDSIIQTI